MPKRIHRYDLLLVSPLGEWSNIGCWFSIGEVWSEEAVNIIVLGNRFKVSVGIINHSTQRIRYHWLSLSLDV
jgi:hypothetical protein